MYLWGRSSAGRASEWHSEGQRFDPVRLHHKRQDFSCRFLPFNHGGILMGKKFISLFLSAIMIATVLSFSIPEETVVKSASTVIKPPANTHPRVLFTKNDIQSIKDSAKTDQNINAYDKLYSYYKEVVLGKFSADCKGKYNEYNLAAIESAAFYYALYGNTNNDQCGEKVINYLLTYLNTCGKNASDLASNTTSQSRIAGHIIQVASEVYDWCYDKLSSDQKNTIINHCENLTKYMEMSYPNTNMSPINGHGSEAQLLRDLLSFAIATYDERPDIWESIGKRFYNQYVPFREWQYQGHYNLEGDTYGPYRYVWDSWAYLLITGMGAPEPYSGENLSKAAYSTIYMRRPDGQWLRDGDSAADTTNSMWDYWTDYHLGTVINAGIGNDPYIKQEYVRRFPSMTGFYEKSPIINLVTNIATKSSNHPLSHKNLPLSKHFPSPAGLTVARTGWDDGVDSPSVVAEMKVGGLNTVNHQHLDAGHFQIYYKGILASDSGVYQGLKNDSSTGGTTYGSVHYNMYNTKAVAHNTMLVLDPNEYTGTSTNRNYTRDGGQITTNGGQSSSSVSELKSKNVVADVVAQEIDPRNPNEPNYTYLKGDLKKSYSSKVSEFNRSFMFLNMKNSEVPAVMIVFDRVTSSSASYVKKWLLHGLEEPEINGTQTIFRRTYADPNANESYNGKMTVDTLLPQSPKISKVGGSSSDGSDSIIYDRGSNTKVPGYPANTPTDEGSTWRIEISPNVNASTTHFLNVIQVSDNDKNYYIKPVKIDKTYIYGVQISDRVVTFSKSGDKISSTVSFSITGTGTYDVTLCDMAKGTWRVTTKDGNQNIVSSEEGGVLAFSAPAGSVRAEFVSSSGTPLVYQPTYGTKVYYSTRINDRFVYTPAEPQMKNGVFVIPLSTIVKYFNLTSSTVGNTTTISNEKSFRVTVTENSAVATTNSEGKETINLDSKVYIDEDSGELMVPAKSIVKTFGGSFSYSELPSTAYITTPSNPVVPIGSNVIIKYSTDGGKTYSKIPNFKESVYSYDVYLPDYTYTVDIDTSDGIKQPKTISLRSIMRKDANDYNPLTKKALVGDFHNKNLSTAFTTEYPLPVDLVGNVKATVPISNEETECSVYYDNNGESVSYDIVFHSKQARLTEFVQDDDFNLGKSETSNYDVVFIGGAAVNNDNRTLIDTSEPVFNGDTYNGTTWALANVSKDLEGASIFVIPETQMADSKNSRGDRNRTIFSFKADTDGRVVVLMGNEAGSNSVYANEEENWITSSDSGITPSGIITSVSDAVSPRNKNDYESPRYYATAIGWKSNNNRGAQRYNTYRLVSPGIAGAITSTHIRNAYALKYSYYKDFKAGENVNINNPGTLIYVSGNLNGSANNVFAVLVIWDKKPKVTIDSVSSNIGTTTDFSVTASTQNLSSDEFDMYAVVYQGNKMMALKKQDFVVGNNNIKLDYTPLGGEVVKFMVFEKDTITPLIKNIKTYNLSGEEVK